MTSRGREPAAEISVIVDAAGPGQDREWFQASETPSHREDSMSHRAQLTTCIAAAAVPAFAIVLLASGAPAAAGTAAAAHRPVILRLRALSGQERQVDMPPAGTSLGDEQVASGRLYRPSGQVAGTFGFICTTVAVSASGSAEQCVGWGAFPDGQIEVAGMSHGQDTIHHWAVTGGTGAYHAARGTLTARDLSDTADELTIRLR
jgi:hypothetical protein